MSDTTKLASAGSGSAPQPDDSSSGGLTLEQLLDLVERAARGDAGLGAQLFEALCGMASDRDQPAELRALAGALLRILIGDRNPSLDALPPELAGAVAARLGRLGAG